MLLIIYKICMRKKLFSYLHVISLAYDRSASQSTSKAVGLEDLNRVRGEKRIGREGRLGQGLYLHLEVRDELSHSDFLCDLLVQTLAVQDHALQDGQGPLQD